jgi:hypothetical protein
MYDKISLSVLHRMQWMAESAEAIHTLHARPDDSPFDKKMISEVFPRLKQIHYASRMAEHYFVEDHFRQLALFAMETVPLDLVFDESLLVTPTGWMEVENGILPFGHPDKDRLDTLIWYKPGDFNTSGKYQFKLITRTPLWGVDKPYEHDDALLWTDFGMKPGETLAQLIERVPDADGFAQFVLCLLHLLGQRMTAVVPAVPRGNVMGRAHAAGVLNLKPRRVTLRRMMPEDHVPTEREREHHDYQWQWHVRGHWRRQPYRTTGEIRPVFIEAYIKGPVGKPLKPLTHSIFVARR